MNTLSRQWLMLSMLMVSTSLGCGRWFYDEFMGQETFDELGTSAGCDLLDECGYLDAWDWTYKKCAKEFRGAYVCDEGHDMTDASNCYYELIEMTCEDADQGFDKAAPSCAKVCD
jgi:hypothetical protein